MRSSAADRRDAGGGGDGAGAHRPSAVAPGFGEAGGRFSDWHGRPRIDSGDGLATNGLVHAEVLASLRLP